MPVSAVTCQSRLARVVVYARGALVTRSVELPAELPEDSIDLRVPGVTPCLEPGGLRALALGDREVLGIRSRLVVPDRSAGGGELLERVRQLQREHQVLESSQAELLSRRESVLASRPRTALNGRVRRTDPAGRTDDALAVNRLLDELAADLDARLLELERKLGESTRAIAVAQAAYAQATSAARAMPGHPTRELFIRLAPGKGWLEKLELEYPVQAARWWPAYSARLSQGSAQLSLEAFVAQASFEDWSNVQLGLCTADLSRDARLPELPSLRLGRAQPPKRSGFRPPPAGLDALFEGFDRLGPLELESPAPSAPEEPPLLEEPTPAPMDLASYGGAGASGGLAPRDELAKGAAPMRRPMPPPAAAPMAPPPPAPVSAAAPAPALRARRAPSPMALKKAKEEREDLYEDREQIQDELSESAPELAALDESLGDAWLDFDNLRLAGAAQPRRGRLVQAPPATASSLAQQARDKLEYLPGPAMAADPLAARGMFDHRFDADGLSEIPSTGVPQRVALRVAEAKVSQRFRAVPGQGPEVYREAELANPFQAPLLAGPVDVFVEGALLTTAALSPVDKGGSILLGLGVEERLRLARNARVEEVSLGVLGSKTGIDHAISVEVASALGHDLELEVLERLPVTDDKEVEVALLVSEPKAQLYSQSERGAPVRGGLRFVLPIKAGAKASLSFSYRITLPSKSELQGGNRRE